ncbi:spermidine/putrescine ABC transporter substrate-binding protein [Janibacter sp. YIM B02568]|jgi:spermidine/putrescine transport system substrate-binding protein|uniref:polyamine ABC transporter substrate-binding protein n=1 Tax=Janibacter endophyticus TaxID=2806261 RepID=UPI001950D639|nr:spermidine/putrescine ABC transporter substrate-binding protein [Janibacter endophyticus]MBM6545951.1 spermidine/putrescine ABC transporter substrate-binding protein [Janibacter endophyticus]
MNDMNDLAFRAALARGLVSRRTAVLGLAGLGVLGLSACGSEGKGGGTAGSGSPSAAASAEDLSDSEKVVSWSNWPEYIDVDDNGKRPSIEAFTKATGIEVRYTEDYNDNDEFYAKVRPLLEAGDDTGRDVWCSTDWMVSRLIRQGYVQELSYDNIPNGGNVVESLSDVEFDPGRKFSLPWQSGFAGIAYNPASTGGKKIESIDQLFNDTSIKGRVTLLTEMRDTVGLVLLELGKDITSFTAEDFDEAIAYIQDAKDRGQLQGFTGNEYTQSLASGDIAACIAWTGDVVQLQFDNPKLGYALPQKGFTIWSDNFVIPAMAKHKKNAELLINHYFDPEVMAEVAAWVNYIPPVTGTEEKLAALDPELGKNQLIAPSEETLSRAHVFRGLSDEEETDFTAKYQAIVVG